MVAACTSNFSAIAKGEPATSARPAAATESPNKQVTVDDVRRWIKELSHDSFPVRQNAAAKLLDAGAIARDPLVELAVGPDPETRSAARRLIALIDRAEFRRRLDAFAADTDGKQGLTLPGWEPFQKIAAKDPDARALFVDMQRQEGSLLAAAFGAAKQSADDFWERRLQRVAQWQVGGDRTAMPSMGSCATMVFLGTLPEMKASDAATQQIQFIIQRPPVKEVLASSTSQVAMQKLVLNWLLQCPNTNEALLLQRLQIIFTHGLKNALPLALSVCGGDPQYLHVQPMTKATAILIVGQFGDREHIPQLEPLLEDASVCMPPQVLVPGQPPTSVQVRDVALNVLLILTGQSPADYGYTSAKMSSPRTFTLQTLSRDNDQQRAEAIAKWKKWWTEHKESKDAPPGK